MQAIRILIVDDHPVVRNGIRAILSTEADFEVVGEAGDGREAIAAFKAHAPDVVLMDLKMPKMEGRDAIAAILRQYPEARIVVLTTFDGDEDIHRALQLGAMGYVLKDAVGTEIVAAVRAAHAGKRHVSTDAAKQLAERPMGRDLTDRELQVLEGIAKGRSNKEIGDELSISEATVKSHVNAILAKLEANDRTHAAMIAMKRGLIR
ncbi:MAG TPA: response regulator transcription factor [Candidatus Polarisedimenticolaceae bacterium]|nr:response regulator transcription factor [Candidatus Polarisedimenticolaceae bacterium]